VKDAKPDPPPTPIKEPNVKPGQPEISDPVMPPTKLPGNPPQKRMKKTSTHSNFGGIWRMQLHMTNSAMMIVTRDAAIAAPAKAQENIDSHPQAIAPTPAPIRPPSNAAAKAITPQTSSENQKTRTTSEEWNFVVGSGGGEVSTIGCFDAVRRL